MALNGGGGKLVGNRKIYVCESNLAPMGMSVPAPGQNQCIQSSAL